LVEQETRTMTLSFPSFAAALHTDGPAADRTGPMALYGQFIGDWTMDGTVYLPDGATHTGTGEIHFGWVLQGRAIQDVWIFPGAFFGTTLRVYDPALDAWHILWSDPVKQYFTRQIGRPRGNDIEQNGTNEQGEPIRWSFTEITRDSFRWTGERAAAGSTAYARQAEFFARRA
jgi:hypothetical protein